jgi:activator of 2-hydroxyglutaryl-CoA dehydratase
MFVGFDIGASSVNAVLLDRDDRVVAVAAADQPGQTRAARLDAVSKRARRFEASQTDATRAATFTASHARWRRLAAFAKEIRQ